jgi:flavin reductase (DIM6/NTAB) family NADH-FMN oxidoreductase RutF
MTSPNPSWKPGDKLTPPFEEMVDLDPDLMTAPELYKIIIGCIVPRPIAFVSTINGKGEGNLAPYSFFNGVSSNPPCVMLSVARKSSGEKKDTLRNIEETGEFVVNSSNSWLVEPLVHTAAEFPHGVDEMKVVGLTPLASTKVRPPRVKESAWQFECVTYKLVEVGDGSPGSSVVVIGKIVAAHVSKQAYQNGRIVLESIDPVARVGGFGYMSAGVRFDIPVPKIS